jgi:hypothetical protein
MQREGRAADMVILAALPMAFAMLAFVFRWHSAPFWLTFNVDPSYFYLLNSLMVAGGEAPADVYHPGTPVQMLAALVIRLMHPFSSSVAIADMVMASPERHLTYISTVLLLLVAGGLFLLGLMAKRTLGGLLPGLLAQSAPFATLFLIKHAYQVKPEPMLLLAATLLCAALLSSLNGQRPYRHAVLMAGAVALGAAAKLHFAPLALVPLPWLLRQPKALVLYGAAGAAAFFLFLAPAWPNLGVTIDWFTKMALSSDAYGQGETTILPWKEYPANILKVFAGKPVFDAVLVLSIPALIWGKGERGLKQALLGIVLAQLASVLLVAKHPIAYYMTPAVALTGAQAALVFALGAKRFLSPRYAQGWTIGLVLLGLLRLQSFVADDAERADWKRTALGIDMKPFAACAKVWYDFASSPSYALFMGDMMSKWRWGPLLEATAQGKGGTEDEFFLNFYTGHLRDWLGPVDVQDLFQRFPCVAFRGAWEVNLRNYLAKHAPERLPKMETCRTDANGETLLTYGASCKPSMPVMKSSR